MEFIWDLGFEIWNLSKIRIADLYFILTYFTLSDIRLLYVIMVFMRNVVSLRESIRNACDRV